MLVRQELGPFDSLDALHRPRQVKTLREFSRAAGAMDFGKCPGEPEKV